MSVQKLYPGNYPKDAIILNEQEAAAHQLDLIAKWDKTSEVWPIKYGISILGIASSLTGMYINDHYRKKLKLRNIGFMTTYLPIVVLPGMISSLLHKMLVTHDIILDKIECPLCIQTRGAVVQAGVGFIYPIILAPLGSCVYATRHGTYRLPNLMTDFLGAGKILFKFTKPIGTQLSVLFIGQMILGSYFTYLEAKSYYTVKQRMLEIERDYDNSIINSGNDEI